MKRIVYLLFVLIGATFIGCDPMGDIYNDLDDQNSSAVVGTDEYTLTEDDYEALDLTYGSFDSEDDAREMIPGLLADMYPYWGAGSQVLVSYNLYVGDAEGLSDFTGADVYQLTTADYAASGSDAFGYYPNVDATEEIISVLDAQISSPSEGQIVLAQYRQYLEIPEVGFANLYEYGFNGTLDGFESVNVLGDQVWEAASFGGVEYAYMSGYDSGSIVNEDWLISPELDLSGESDVRVQINQAINYASDLALLGVWVSSDYTTGGDVSSATWELIDFANAPAGNNWSFVLSEDYDLSAYDGETIHIAFKYESTTEEAASWEIDELFVKSLGVSGDYDSKGEYFVYSEGAWEVMEDVYYLSSEDYNSMGEGAGQPGQYDNFSSSTPADSYLPTFLSIKYPYAQEEDQIFVIYKYYSSSAGAVQIRGNSYTVIEGEWTPHASTVETTLQFGHDGTEWVPDNTIQYTLTRDDYDYIVSQLENEPGYEAATSSMDNYGNLDRRPSQAAYWSDADTQNSAGITDMIANAMGVLLDHIDPAAEEEQKYLLTYDIYNGTNTTESIAMIKVGGAWVRND
ncbi:choice-of-anchor J domain-containing protein [Mangrovimonas xylaniphaga]|uniref:choice-of-anchor J domain-containing protein n=1 Tax=Mangrovimonas xylaniphaga TaxID=1645915 RepID=UPI0006B603B8|nr:choice-of-anchor J domain-containing protein [Mangrovimonas xylaniphaga]